MSFPSAANVAEPRKPKVSGADIRARIEANARKRRAIAEAMKCEAGVRGHIENRTDGTGAAWLHTGNIETPESRNIMNLYIVAHECGHVFLHREGIGRFLPSHVQEYEAECYAHQALRQHGMEVPWPQTARARAYVAEHIANNRAEGLLIDPAVEDFAFRGATPFKPIRRLPQTWPKSSPASIDDLYHPAVVKRARRLFEAYEAILRRRSHERRWAWFDYVWIRLAGIVGAWDVLKRFLASALQLGLFGWSMHHINTIQAPQLWATESVLTIVLPLVLALSLYATEMIRLIGERRRETKRMSLPSAGRVQASTLLQGAPPCATPFTPPPLRRTLTALGSARWTNTYRPIY